MAQERGRADLREHIGDGGLRSAPAKPRHKPVHPRHVGRGLQLEDRDLPGLREPAGDCLARARQVAALNLSRRDRRGRHGRRGLTPLDVFCDDPLKRNPECPAKDKNEIEAEKPTDIGGVKAKMCVR